MNLHRDEPGGIQVISVAFLSRLMVKLPRDKLVGILIRRIRHHENLRVDVARPPMVVEARLVAARLVNRRTKYVLGEYRK